MSATCKSCYWSEQCGGECQQNCENYTPVDGSELEELEYLESLRERADAYGAVVKEFSDWSDDFGG